MIRPPWRRKDLKVSNAPATATYADTQRLVRLRGSGVDRSSVGLHDVEPGRDVLSVIVAQTVRHNEISLQECRAQLDDQLLGGIGFFAKTPAKLTFKPAVATDPSQFPKIPRHQPTFEASILISRP